MAAPTGIDRTAPVIARHEIAIAAPLDVVWNLHIDVANWPSWNPDITGVTSEQPFAPDASFLWHTAGLEIRSTVYAVTEHARTLWGGDVAGIHGIHEWTFTTTGDSTRVATEESWSGEPVAANVAANVAAMQNGLDQSLVSWLGHLKSAAEAKG
ncbi:MAG: SRPBCC family protein [Chloroflexia bacterium]|nr:SRPBCC family protein [Chloroflexia bacterium]